MKKLFLILAAFPTFALCADEPIVDQQLRDTGLTVTVFGNEVLVFHNNIQVGIGKNSLGSGYDLYDMQGNKAGLLTKRYDGTWALSTLPF